MKIGNWILKIHVHTFALLCFIFVSISLAPEAQAAAPTNGLVGYWAFDEGSGTTAGDSSGNGNNGTLTNGPTWVAGKAGNGAVTLDGVDDRVLISTVPTIT